jgi:hypothetical protein
MNSRVREADGFGFPFLSTTGNVHKRRTGDLR